MKSRRLKYVVHAATVIAMLAVSCSKKEEDTQIVPPGFCKTQEQCQPMADRQNTYQGELRRKLLSQGVHDQYLPCGKYEVTKAANGFWQVTGDSTSCPSTASQPDPHPDPSHRHE